MRPLLLLLALLLPACGATPIPTTHAGDDLRGLAAFLDATHPRLHAYVSEAELAALIEVEAARLDALEAPDDLQVGLAFHRVLARIGDGHLAVALPSLQPDAAPLALLPIVPRRVGDVVLVDALSEGFAPGTEVVSIDGASMADLYAASEALVLADGLNASATRAELERSFARYHLLLHGSQPTHALTLRAPDGALTTRTLASVDREALAALQAGRLSAVDLGAAPPSGEPAWPFLVRVDASTVLLRLASFGVSESDEYTRRVDAIFDGLEGAETLVIDLRGNQGGLRTLGIAVLQHVLGAPYTQWRETVVRVRAIPDAFRPQVEFPFVPESALQQGFPEAPDALGFYRRAGDPLADLMRPEGPAFTGHVVVFADGTTNSAAVEMLTALRANRPEMVFIGRETGGECGRHVGEVPVVYRAPLSEVRVLISLMAIDHVMTEGCTLGRGQRPDIEVTLTRDDVLAGRDPYLAQLR